MSKNPDLLSARNVILASAAVLALSVLGMCISMLRPNDTKGLAQDSFGTRGGGYRGLFEVLAELGVAVRRHIAPPAGEEDTSQTLVLLNPNPRLVGVGPKYLHALRTWVERGGRVVVTPSTSHDPFWEASRGPDDANEVDVLSALGIDDAVTVGDLSEDYVERDYTTENNRRGGGSRGAGRAEKSWGENWAAWHKELLPPDTIAITLEGSLEPLAADVKQLAVPGEGFLTLRGEPDKLQGSIRVMGKKDKQHLIAAVIRRGAGEIVVVAEPAVWSNRLIAQADNSVLAANLLAPQHNPVVFDEFYHGLAVRGNPLYLLTRPGFAAAFVGVLLVAGVLAWRSAVFLGPPLSAAKPSRRDLGEYVSAMAQFFCRGRGSRRFLMSEVRDGVLRQICRELKLPFDTLELDRITSALERRDRGRAQRLESAVREVDAALAAGGEFPRSSFIPAMQRLVRCL